MLHHRENPGFGVLCDAVAYRRLVVVTGSGVSVGSRASWIRGSTSSAYVALRDERNCARNLLRA